MADIHEKILSKYNIDITHENILKLYKIDSPDISPEDLEAKIQDTRKRWNTSVNGANEKNAERDRLRLEKANKYEEILRDDQLRKELFSYNQKTSGANKKGKKPSEGGTTEFAKEYFELIATTKKIKKDDVDFFFQYYHSERKNKKAILEMLNKEMKVNGLGKEESYANESDTIEEEGKKKDDSNPIIVNLFQEATVLKISSAVEKYETALQSEEVRKKYPKLEKGLYEFLEINDVEDAKQFRDRMDTKGKEVFAVRQERGSEYLPLVEMFNTLKSIGDNQDVVDNISEFKLLLMYPNLTPYMFAFVDMKPDTIKGMVEVASRDYQFRNDADFILNYYMPLRDNFGISDSSIRSILRNAEKKAKTNKILNGIDEKLGRSKKKRKISIGAEIIHWLVYWPIFLIYFVFEITKVIFTRLHRLAIPVFATLFVLANWLIPRKFGIENILALRKLFFKSQWLSYLNEFLNLDLVNGLTIFLVSFIAIILLLTIYILPPLTIAVFVSDFADNFNKRFDWVGIERTFRHILDILKKKTEDLYLSHKKLYIKKQIPKIMINIACVLFLIASIYFIPIGFHKLGEITGYGQTENFVTTENMIVDQPLEESDDLPVGDTMIITSSTANIRSGPGTDYDILATANEGDTFLSTGNQEVTSGGKTWFEIYLDNDMTETGWASQKVIAVQ